MTPVAALPASRNGAQAARGAPAPMPAIPFVAAAHEHVEPAFTAVVTPGASAQTLGPFEVPAFGFLRHIFLEVTATGGTLGAGALHEDAPFNLFANITLNDVNGAPIFGPLPGYSVLWTNIAGGYAYTQDPRRAQDYVGTINSTFGLRVPVEINHFDAMGSISNQNAAASYKLELQINPSATIFATAPTTVPQFTIRGWLEAWTLPNETDIAGRPQVQLPPAHGTTQYWSRQINSVVSGANGVRLTRVGSLIRNIIVIARNTTPVRSDSVFFDPFRFDWDARNIYAASQRYWKQLMNERLESLFQRDSGVFIFSYAHSENNRAGDGPPSLWLPTVQSSRLEFSGNNTAQGTLEIITNDVAPAEILPSERFVETSATGFHPQSGATAR